MYAIRSYYDIRTEVVNETNRPQKATLVQRVVDADGDVVLKLTQTAVIAPNMRYRFCQTGGIEDDVKFWDLDVITSYSIHYTKLYEEYIVRSISCLFQMSLYMIME